MLKKTVLGVLFAVFVSGLLIAGINFNVAKAVDYGSSGTTVGGIIWENTTWTLENSPCIITDTVQIPENVTLTIEPGVIVTNHMAGDIGLAKIVLANTTVSLTKHSQLEDNDNVTISLNTNVFYSTALKNITLYYNSTSDSSLWVGCIPYNESGSRIGTSVYGFTRIRLYGEMDLRSHLESVANELIDLKYIKKGDMLTYRLFFVPDTGSGINETIDTVIISYFTRESSNMFLVYGTICAHGNIDNKIIFDGGGNSNFFSAEGSKEDAFLDLDYCIIRNGLSFWPPTGYEQYGHFILRHSELINLAGYSYIWYPRKDSYIEYNKFINTAGFAVANHYANIYIRYNLFKGNSGFLVQNYASYGESETIVKYNSFIDMSGIVLKLPSGYSSAAMTATENYWGTNDTDVIDTMIYDKNDDITCADFIEYLPILTEPHPDTPTLPLIVNFTYSPSTLYTYGTVTFNASVSFGPYSTIANYTWDFGDGNNITLNTPIVTYTYTVSGSYNVTLTVTDEFRFKNSTTTSVMVLQDDAPPTIEIPSRIPEGDVEPDQEVRILVNVTDLESGIKDVTLSCLNIYKPVSNFTTVKDLNITLWLHRPTYYYKDPVSGNVKITYPNGTAFRGAFILYILHLTQEVMSTTAGIAIDGFTKFYLSPPVFRFGPGNYTIGMSSLSTADGYIIESRWQVFPSVQVEAKDDSMVWIDLPMTFNSTTRLYEAIIPGQQANTLIKYRIEAYDNALNHKVDDNSGQYYVYTVIPEFPQPIILLLFAFTTLIATILLKKKVRPKSPPQFSLK